MIETTNSPSPQPVSDEDIERLYRQYGNDVLRVSYFYLGNRSRLRMSPRMSLCG